MAQKYNVKLSGEELSAITRALDGYRERLELAERDVADDEEFAELGFLPYIESAQTKIVKALKREVKYERKQAAKAFRRARRRRADESEAK
jgi:MinD-like ATPase involved in chromosome partitioning or flagellar assembly